VPVAHLGHVELTVTDLEASATFLTQIVGLQVSEQGDDAVYLRAWQDFDHHTVKLTEGSGPGVVHIAWRVPTREDAVEIEREVKARGLESHWIDGSEMLGHGDALRVTSPGGLPYELYWEVDAYLAPESERSQFPSHPSRRSLGGAAARRVDHVGVNANDVAAEQDFLTNVLGIHHRYFGTGPDGTREFSWVSRTSLSHEMSVVRNRQGTGGGFHHLAYFVESTDDVLRTASRLVDYGHTIDWGPGQHGTSGATALYFKEPGGNRIEIWTGGLMIFAPDWKPIGWSGEVLYAVADIWGQAGTPDKFLAPTPVVADRVAAASS
jgi:catechol 2,3-dioxygenase